MVRRKGRVGFQRLGDAAVDRKVVGLGVLAFADEAGAALAEADRGVEPFVALEESSVGLDEADFEAIDGGLGAGDVEHSCAEVDAGDAEAASGEFQGVASRAATDVEDRRAPGEREKAEEEVDLGGGVPGEGLGVVLRREGVEERGPGGHGLIVARAPRPQSSEPDLGSGHR